jgi:hypothetical protein
MDYQKGTHKGFAFVEYEDPEVRQQACRVANRKCMCVYVCIYGLSFFMLKNRMRQKPFSTWTAPNSWEEL